VATVPLVSVVGAGVSFPQAASRAIVATAAIPEAGRRKRAGW